MPIGKLEVFDAETNNWSLYVERVEQYFIVNDIKLELKVPTLITVMGSASYELLVTLCTPKKPSSLSFEEIVKIMQCHLQPKPNVLAERYKFRLRKQWKRENIATYVAELKKLTKFCDFEKELDNNLRDQFVCGLESDVIRQRLFEGEIPTFAKALQLAVAMEAAEADAALVESRGRERGGGDDGGKDLSQAAALHNLAAGSRGSKAPGTRAARPWVQRRDTTKGSSEKEVRGSPQAGQRRSGTAASRCSACGASHDAHSCRFRLYTCRVCNKEGHLKKMCPRMSANADTMWTQTNDRLNEVTSSEEDCYDTLEQVNLNAFQLNGSERYKPYFINVLVDGKSIEMEVDTGSRISCVSYEFYTRMFYKTPLIKCNLVMNYYTGEKVYPRGKIKPYVQYAQTYKQVDLYVIDNGKKPLLGREWLRDLQIRLQDIDNLNVNDCNKISSSQVFNVNDLYSRYSNVLSDGLGCFTGGVVSLHVRPDARPVFMRARPLAYALRERVEQALDQLERDGIITPVETSDWATPIVPVVKKDGSLRLCGDYKVTLNKCLEVDRFPLPRIEDLLARLHSGQKYSKIDLSQAYAQFCLDEPSKSYTVINTHRGLYRYNRLIYGVSSSPGIFQRKIEQIFSDMPRVGVFLDDVILTGQDDAEHIDTLYKVFDRLQRYGLKVKREKCTFFADEVTYLGFIISKDGVKTCSDKVEAIQKVPIPSNVSELRSFLGMVMYYAKFVKNISMTLTPLYELLRKDSKFVWTESCTEVFNKIKRLLSSSVVLMHYNPEMPVTLTTDASAKGIGAVIAHVLSDGTERPIAYASRVLNAAEVNYSQIEREALAIIFGVKKFHQYLYGRSFILKTDHKPLVTIFGDKAGIPTMAASRLQRWAVILSGYRYNIQYIPTDKNSADVFSRLPVGRRIKDDQETTYVNFVQELLPVTSDDISKHVDKDDLLRKVMIFLRSGWPVSCPKPELQAYFVRKNELYVDSGCVMWGYRMVIPSALRTRILKELHVSHVGIVKMKALARSYVWWPGIDADIEHVCHECRTCRSEAPAPPKAPPQPWPYVSEPWSRLHMDFLGPFHGKMFFVIVDSSTKWIEAFEMRRTTGKELLRVLRDVLARFGLPKEIVSDNGPPFTGAEVTDFMHGNGIKHIFTPVYHPASNGAAENAVKLCKRALKKALRDGSDLDTALKSYLFTYRNTVHSTTGESPARLLQHRTLRSRLDLLNPVNNIVKQRVEKAQQKQVEDAGGKVRILEVGDTVWARGFGGEEKWLTVSEQGPHEKRLLNALLANYNTLERPVANESEPLEVRFGLTLQQIIDVDEKNQLLITNIWLSLEWNDYNLRWNDSEYGGVKDLRITPNKLWKPDVLMYNSADEGFDGTYQTNVVVRNNGSCLYVPPGIFKSTCKIDITWFPFDDQHCDMKFGSWTYDGNQLDLVLKDEAGGDLSDFITNGEWYLIGMPGKKNTITYACCPEPYVDVTFTIMIRRRTLYYFFNLIVPCVLISSMALLGFTLPPDSGEKLTLGVTILLSLTVFLNLVAETLPQVSDAIPLLGVTILLSQTVFSLLVGHVITKTSEAIPLIGTYFNCIMFMVASSVVLTVVVLNYHHRTADIHEMPQWIKSVFLQWLPWILRMSRPGKKITRKTIMMNTRMRELELKERSSKSLLANVLDIDDDFRHGPPPPNSTASTGNLGPGCSIFRTDFRRSFVRPSTMEDVGGGLGGHHRELHLILREVQFITARMKKADEEAELISDWKFAAMVVDRFCLFVFTLFTIIATVAVLLSAPHIIVQ